MELKKLVAGLPARKASIHTYERGKTVSRPHAGLCDDVMRARQAMAEWGVAPGMRVGLYAPNSYQWLVHDLALMEMGAISVPFTDDFAGTVNEELLDRYDISLLLLAKRHAGLFPGKPSHVAFLDSENGPVQAHPRRHPHEADEDDQHSLVFSSGSAGGLKGLVISRRGVEETLPPIIKALEVRPDDRLMLFLPMSNFQQRNMCYAALYYDFDVIITDYTQLFAAMPALNPTILIAPPVLYQMIHADFTRYPRWKQKLWMTLGAIIGLVPSAVARRGLSRRIFRDFHQQLGNRMRLLVTGMAPIRRDIGLFFERMGLPLCESYGMVEAGSLTYRSADSRKYASVGKLLPGIRASLTEDGEIIVHRDHPLTTRYFQCQAGENERTFLAPGRIATGDIGEFDADGDLYLRGRKKELIITPGGYKIHPEIIEREMNNCPGVAHSVIALKGDNGQLTCIVDLAPPRNEETRTRVKKFAAGLTSIRQAAQFVDVIFADEPFTPENGMLRPNLKIDRKAVAARYL
jgi:long-subunit acyl-CoA synthetase (AMP-forming)